MTSPALDFYPFGPAPSDTFAPTPPVCQRRGVFSHRCDPTPPPAPPVRR